MMRLWNSRASSTPTEPSAEFRSNVDEALRRAAQVPDDATAYMATHVPVYVMADNTPEQAQACGHSPETRLRGMWARQWSGYPSAPHGIVWIFEKGCRMQGGEPVGVILETIIHEFGHCLQRDHVLDALDQRAAHSSRGCATCPGR